MAHVVYTLIKCAAGQEIDVFAKLKQLGEECGWIKEIALLYGLYDIFLRIEIDSTDNLKNLILRIRSFPGISETYTFLAMERVIL
ncbi:MAG: Lrp/AsnC ligand binding domain-containing protein [Candidatus Korarchaeota archaeon]